MGFPLLWGAAFCDSRLLCWWYIEKSTPSSVYLRLAGTTAGSATSKQDGCQIRSVAFDGFLDWRQSGGRGKNKKKHKTIVFIDVKENTQ
jgi:hypothetical protein